ncbi:UNVERIFIED_CONTAM: hypothetical protein FKN15_012475 [Acipenser sinensis]
MADLEDRNRHSKLHLTGLQEGVQGADTVDFLTIVVPNPDWDGHSNNAGSPYLRYSDPQAILQAARKETSRSAAKELKLFLDYSNFTAQHHKAFPQSITFARSRGLLTFLIYLAALKINHNSEVHLFQSPDDAQAFLDSLGLPERPQASCFSPSPVGYCDGERRNPSCRSASRPRRTFGKARVQEPDKAPLLDAPITPGHTFGPAMEEILQRSVKTREASQQMAKMWPHKPFQPRRQQEHQWRRAPPATARGY